MANRTREQLPDVVIRRTLKGRKKEFTLRKPLTFHVEKIDDDYFNVSNSDLGIHSSGETEEEALQSARNTFEGFWAFLVDKPPEELNFIARRIRVKLLEFAEERKR